MKFERICTRYDNGKCRLCGYNCHVLRERGDNALVFVGKQIACYHFTRDVEEGKRVLEKIV